MKLATLDAETDPFEYNRVPEPFAWGFFNGDDYIETWGDNCTDEILQRLKELKEPHRIYAHNGGKFDFFFLLKHGVIHSPKIINGRIVQAGLLHHEIRDSYAILPVPLAAYQKDEIDYKLFEREARDKYKDEISHYLAKDCEYLYQLVEAFIERFGVNLTIGGTAIKELRKLHPFEKQDETHDAAIRPFYFGGRVECFERGLLSGNFASYDVNSMYPAVMAHEKHPTGSDYIELGHDDLPREFFKTGELNGLPYFVEFAGYSYGALPVRTDAGLSFPKNSGTFLTTNHEMKAGLDLGLIQIDRINRLIECQNFIVFDDFVDMCMTGKIQAKRDGNKAEELFNKLLANSSYGKFAQNPENFVEYLITYPDDPIPDLAEWDLEIETPDYMLWTQPAERPVYYDVATAASITSAARAMLLRGLSQAVRPVYCDTDSIICEGFAGEVHPFRLGAWDKEAEGDSIAIAGKKLYALFNGSEAVKYASKGARLDPEDIVKLANGKEITWRNPAPTFRLSGKVEFITRTLKKV